MGILRWPLRLYLIAVAVAAALAFGAAAAQHAPSRLPNGALIFATLLVFGALAQVKPLKLSLKIRIGVADTAVFAAILLFSPFEAMLLGAGKTVLAKVLGTAFLRQRAPWYQHMFNVSSAALATGAGAATYHALAGGTPAVMEDPLAVVASAMVYYLLHTSLLDVVVALQLRRQLFAAWWPVHRRDILQHTALYLLGTLAALSVTSTPWALVLFLAPAGIIYLSLREILRLREQTRATIYELADLVDRRDPYTHGHSQRVAEYASQLAGRLRYGEYEVELIREAARMHDLGKITTPDQILQKPGALTPQELAVMRTHAEFGAQMLARIPEFWEGAALVRSHHERYDGQGYPRALQTNEIPREAAIIAVADAYDAMTTDRPYRKAMDWPQVRAELERGRGTQWEADIVDAFLDLMEPRAAASRVEVAAAT